MPRSFSTLAGCAALGIFLSFQPSAVQADEFTDVIQEVLELYQEGDISEAKEALEYAEQLLGKMKADSLLEFFPEAMDGWQTEPFEGGMAGMTAFGGGISLGQLYRKGSETVEMSLIGDSPMIQQFGIMFSNAAMVESSGGRMIRIKRQNAVITEDNEIQMMIANRFLLTVGGSADEETKIAYVKEFDTRGLAKSP